MNQSHADDYERKFLSREHIAIGFCGKNPAEFPGTIHFLWKNDAATLGSLLNRAKCRIVVRIAGLEL